MGCDDRFAFVNPAAARLLGARESADLLGTALYERIHANNRSLVRDAMAERSQAQRTPAVRGAMLRMDGTPVDVEIIASPYRFEGRPAVLMVVREILAEQQEARVPRTPLEQLIVALASRLLDVAAEDVDRGIEAALEGVARFTGGDRASVFVVSENGAEVRLTHAWHRPGAGPSSTDDVRLLPTELYAWWRERLRLLGVVHVPDLEQLPREAAREKAFLEGRGIRSVIAVPLGRAPAFSGFLAVSTVTESRQWGKEDVAVLKVVAQLVAHALGQTG